MKNFSVLYDDEKFVLVKNVSSGDYSFGLKRDFGTLFGFPVDKSCLTVEEAKSVLLGFIGIDEKFFRFFGRYSKRKHPKMEEHDKCVSTLKELFQTNKQKEEIWLI